MAAECSPGRKPGDQRHHKNTKPALAGDRFLRPLKRAGLENQVRDARGFRLASLASPWAKLCRQLCWLLEDFTLL
jgi:hypothetical protein